MLSFEGERHHALRLLRAVKHRFGSTDELGLFEMTGAGLDGVPDPSALFLADRRPGIAGSVVVPVLDGHRPLLVEIQALVAKSHIPTPRRRPRGSTAAAWPWCWPCSSSASGRRSTSPTSTRWSPAGSRSPSRAPTSRWPSPSCRPARGEPLRDDLVACGEVGLGGELRQVHQTARRLAEAARLGFRRAVVPASAPASAPGIEVLRAATLAEAVDLAGLLQGDTAGVIDVDEVREPPVRSGPHAIDGRRSVVDVVTRPSASEGQLPSTHGTPPQRRAPRRAERRRPGTALRAGLDRILQAKMGGLIVVGDGPEVLNICSGGFLLDAAFSPQRLSELAKMDGAIILAADASRIARANVHLVPNPNVPTSETGTRHRTAERVARSIDVPVISVSEDMAIVAVYAGDQKHTLEPIPRLLTRANQALQTLERYKHRLDEVTGSLSTLEVEDLVTVRDVVTVLQRTEMVRRIAEEIELDIIELGVDGRLVRLQLDELMGGVEDDRRLVLKDYFHEDAGWHVDEALDALAELGTEDLLDLKAVGAALHLPDKVLDLDEGLQPRGYRLLAKIPRLPEQIIERIVARFGTCRR